jgi:hypothetical protein
MLEEIMLEGIIQWLTETPYTNLSHGMPAQYQELHKQQAAIGWDQMLYGRWCTNGMVPTHDHTLQLMSTCTSQGTHRSTILTYQNTPPWVVTDLYGSMGSG